MRVWDQIHPSKLCRHHLLAEHRETLAIWSILTNNKKGYRNHPEVKRWENHLLTLYRRHEAIRREAWCRGYSYWKDVNPWRAMFQCDNEVWPEPWDNQLESLQAKECECKV